MPNYNIQFCLLCELEKGEKIEDIKYKIWISLIKNLGFRRYQKLIQEFKSLEELWNVSKDDLVKIDGIGQKLSEFITNENLKMDINRHIEYMKQHSIDIISIEDNEYPELLKKIYNPPICLYIIGRKDILNQTNIAIVGSRDATEYGKYVANDFAYNLSNNGFNIVSGLARGIDSYAHIGALNANGKTIAVLGNGLDTIFPKENIKLAEKIINRGGCIISEYPLGTRPREK